MTKSLIFTLVLFAVAPAQAAIVFDNTDGAGPDGVAKFSFSNSNFVVDDFILSESMPLTDAHFWAVADPAGASALASALSYVFFNDDGTGHPDMSTFIVAQIGQNVVVNPTGEDPFNTMGTFPRYEVSFDLYEPVAFMAGTTYWFGMTLVAPGGVAWETTTPGQGYTAHNGFPPGETGYEMAFYLTTVPLPVPLLLMGVGLMGILWRSRC